MIPDDWGTGWQDPAVDAELAKPRKRPLKDVDAQRFKIAARLSGAKKRPGIVCALNREVLEGWAWARQLEGELEEKRRAVAEKRRAILHIHRGDRRDEARIARRARIAGLMAIHREMSAQSLATWIKRSPACADITVSLRTLWEDITAIRKHRNASHTHKS